MPGVLLQAAEVNRVESQLQTVAGQKQQLDERLSALTQVAMASLGQIFQQVRGRSQKKDSLQGVGKPSSSESKRTGWWAEQCKHAASGLYFSLKAASRACCSWCVLQCSCEHITVVAAHQLEQHLSVKGAVRSAMLALTPVAAKAELHARLFVCVCVCNL